MCKRWMKGANKFRRMDREKLLINDEDEHADALRLNHMTQMLSKLALVSAPYNDTYVIIMNHFNDASKEVEIAIEKIMVSRASSAHPVIEAALPHPVIEAALPHPVTEATLPHLEASLTHPGTRVSSVHILNPHVSQTKGRKKGKEVVHGSGRIKSSVEIATKKRKRKCRCCNQMVRHDTRTCPLNPNSRKKHVESTEGMIETF
ncbi:hypothetical protein Dimus_000435 [Dionaea muscipula]